MFVTHEPAAECLLVDAEQTLNKCFKVSNTNLLNQQLPSGNVSDSIYWPTLVFLSNLFTYFSALCPIFPCAEKGNITIVKYYILSELQN